MEKYLSSANIITYKQTDGIHHEKESRGFMFRLGEYQNLKVIKKTDFGVYLAEEENAKERVLLPIKQVPKDISLGAELDVFLYRDSKDRMIATTNKPLVTVGTLAVLSVKEVSKIGAFLDWGLEKDLFLPYHEMTTRLKEKDEILVTAYVDKSGRLCATMKKLYALLRQDAPYQAGDEVTGRIYEFGHDFGTFVAVDDCYSAMIPRHEDCKNYRIGDVIAARITNVKEDGKLDLTLRKTAYLQMDEDAKKVLEIIESYAGVLPFTDKASSEVILRETGLSKNAFKRAVGRLYKERKIEITASAIRLHT